MTGIETIIASEGTKMALKETTEATVKESVVKEMLNTIRETSLEALKIQNEETSTFNCMHTINQGLEGKLHPETGIPYKLKEIITDKGIELGVFPDFNKVKIFEMKLPENLLRSDRSIHDRFCNSKLTEAFNNGEIDTSKLTERQIEQIKNGDKPEGFTWHHNEEKGVMQLVPYDIHRISNHTGGYFIWGRGN